MIVAIVMAIAIVMIIAIIRAELNLLGGCQSRILYVRN